jgi:hypothetical protein
MLLKAVTILSSVFYFIPFLIVLFRKCWNVRPVLLFSLYWVLGGLLNLLLLVADSFGSSFNAGLDVFFTYYNVLDPLLVLGIMYYASRSVIIKKSLLVTMGLLVIGIIITAIFVGLKHETIKYVLGFGVVAVFLYALIEILNYIRKLVFHWHEEVMIYIYAAIVYEYGSYLFNYWFDYWYANPTAQEFLDSTLVYNLSTIVAVSISLASFLHAKLNPSKREEKKATAKPTEREILYL